MSAKAIRELTGKALLAKWLVEHKFQFSEQYVQVNRTSDLKNLPQEHPWLLEEPLTVKVDQLVKRRGKLGLVLLNADWDDAVAWINQRRNQEVKAGLVSGIVDTFIVERFIPHQQEDEYYVCIQAGRQGDSVLFHHEGGIDVGDVDSKGLRVTLNINDALEEATVAPLLVGVPPSRRPMLSAFLCSLHEFFVRFHFTYLEINPLLMLNDQLVIPCDMAAKLDECAKFLVGKQWGKVDFPAPFGRPPYPEEEYIRSLDATTGSSLKLTILNPEGRVWTMIAGGGASVVYADAIVDLGHGLEMANYGEYSGDPTESLTYEYAKTILSLLTRSQHPDGKILLIGGGIANFTNIASTFRGIITAIREYAPHLSRGNVRIYVRRGGPNYQEGLNLMRSLGQETGLHIEVYGPEDHITSIVSRSLGLGIADYTPKYIPQLDEAVSHASMRTVRQPSLNMPSGPAFPPPPSSKLRAFRGLDEGGVSNFQRLELGVRTREVKTVDPETAEERKVTVSQPQLSDDQPQDQKSSDGPEAQPQDTQASQDSQDSQDTHDTKENSTAEGRPLSRPLSRVPSIDRMPPALQPWELFTPTSRALVFGIQNKAVQNMLDFDFLCGKSEPSVAGMIYAFSGNRYEKFYFGQREVLIPIYQDMAYAMGKFPDVDVVINFASFRSVYESTVQLLDFPQVKTIALIAEGVPERQSRQLLALARSREVTIIGPATVGGIAPGCFRIGNTGGMLDNILASRLFRAGSVAYVSKSGGMSNEMNNIIARSADGVYEGLAIGGDRYPGTTFVDHLLRFQLNPAIKIMIVLGEVGGQEEYEIVRLMNEGVLTKPLIAWCIGTCADIFPYEVQFGHAGACAEAKRETASAKNVALKAAGAHVPDSFEQIGRLINQVYAGLVDTQQLVPKAEIAPPRIPIDYKWAQKLGLIRKPSSIVSSITDDRGPELVYSGMKITEIFQSSLGLGGTLGLIWFRRRLPDYFCRFIEMVLIVTADHGPAVSGAHNTIVCARAGKDLVSSLCSGLLTIGPRFGGALDAAATLFSRASDENEDPQAFVSRMRKQKKLIMGIGHKIKSLENPDVRVVIIKSFAQKHFHSTEVLDYALEVEKITTAKKSTLILNVDGAIACAFVDLMRSCGVFSRGEVDDYIAIGALNGLFVLGRSIGLVGHYLDQNRLKQPLYRHEVDDISYLVDHSLAL